MRETQQAVAEIFASAARIFDELIIDDFFFTTDASAASNASLASRTVTLYPTNYTNGTAVIPFSVGAATSCTGADGCGEKRWQRRAMMHGVAQRDVLAAATAANPNVRVTLKFPNRYDHYQDHGYDVGATDFRFCLRRLGDAHGETRDYDASSLALVQLERRYEPDAHACCANNLRWKSTKPRSSSVYALIEDATAACAGYASLTSKCQRRGFRMRGAPRAEPRAM